MRFRVLGPLEVVQSGRPVPLGGVKQRATLGLLLLRANRVVATSELLKALWPADDGMPPTARKILQNAVRSLRVIFAMDANAPTLLTQPPGYLLRVEPDQVDVFDFCRRAERGRAELAAGSAEAAALILRDALALWRGSVLSDLVETGVDWPELAAVRNARLDVLEAYFDAELANGRHQAAIGELEVMVEAEPHRERLCHQLMLALYRSGRQAEALNVYARVRSMLVERLGLEPGRGLQSLQQAILAHDPALTPPETSPRLVVLPRASWDLPAPVLERELKVLDGLLECVRHRAVPHLVTVLGPPGAEMTRCIAEFEGLIAGHPDTVRFLRFSGEDSRVQGQILAALQQITLDRPLVLAIENMHRANDRLLDFVENLPELAGPVPLFVVAAAWPELLDRRPEWSGGKLHATTMTLGPRGELTTETRRVPLLAVAS